MKVEIKVDETIEETYAVIYAKGLTPDVLETVQKLKDITATQALPAVLNGKKADKQYVIEPRLVDIIRTEGGVVMCYNYKGEGFVLSKSLNDLVNELGKEFIRASKSSIVNIKRIDHLSASFNGTMYVMMKCGVDDYITKKYMKDFKARLGL